MTAPVELPPFRVIAAALRTTTDRLILEVVAPQETAPDWNEFEWAVARAVCALQGIAGLLATRLRWHGPRAFREFLATQHAHTLARHAQIGDLLAELDSTLGDAGIPFVPLKGSAIRVLPLHEAGERPQSDIDLLLDPSHLGDCKGLLERLGYELLMSVRRHDVYAPIARREPRPYGEHPENPLKIELHTRVSEVLPVERVDITATIPPARPLPGANRYASLAALVRHVCLHAAGNLQMNAVRFIQVHELAQLAARMSSADWRELWGEGPVQSQAWWLYPPFALAARHVPGCVPADKLAKIRSVCPPRLRNRYEKVPFCDVSWSNLRIEALPGHEWSRTVRDTLRFARSRLYRNRVAVDEATVIYSAEPGLQAAPWSRAPQLERILRWVFTRPPRTQTISAVTAALREAS